MVSVAVPRHTDIVAALRRRAVPGGFVGVGFPRGWDAILSEFVFLASEIVPTFQVVQVKDKFATLRLYVDAGVDDPVASALLRTLVRNAEQRSAVTCEECGEPARLRDGGWLRTLCRHHSDEPVDAADMIDEPFAALGATPARDTIRRLTAEIDATEELIAAQDVKLEGDPDSKWWSIGRPQRVAGMEAARRVVDTLTIGIVD